MVYADYSYYSVIYLGISIDADDFPRLAARSSGYIDWVTMGRAKQHAELEEVKMACCALAEEYQAIETARALANRSLSAAMETSGVSGEVQSETVGSWSRSYRSGGDSALSALKSASSAKESLLAVAAQYLAHTGLLRARGYYA